MPIHIHVLSGKTSILLINFRRRGVKSTQKSQTWLKSKETMQICSEFPYAIVLEFGHDTYM